MPPGHRALEQNALTAPPMRAMNLGCERGITPRSQEKMRTKDKFLETDTNWVMIPEKLKSFFIVIISTTAITMENKNRYEDVCREEVNPPGEGERSGE